MNIEKAQLIRYCFRFGAIFSVLALFLPTTYTTSSSSDGFASGLFCGTWYGIEDLLFLLILPPVGLALIALLILQIRYALKTSVSDTSSGLMIPSLFFVLSIILFVIMGTDLIDRLKHHGYYYYGDKLLIGYYSYAFGTLLTTTGLFFSRRHNASKEKNISVNP
jgi:hypothetical protein